MSDSATVGCYSREPVCSLDKAYLYVLNVSLEICVLSFFPRRVVARRHLIKPFATVDDTTRTSGRVLQVYLYSIATPRKHTFLSHDTSARRFPWSVVLRCFLCSIFNTLCGALGFRRFRSSPLLCSLTLPPRHFLALHAHCFPPLRFIQVTTWCLAFVWLICESSYLSSMAEVDEVQSAPTTFLFFSCMSACVCWRKVSFTSSHAAGGGHI